MNFLPRKQPPIPDLSSERDMEWYDIYESLILRLHADVYILDEIYVIEFIPNLSVN